MRPSVTYGTLAYNPIFTKQSIIKALHQNYPDSLKTVVLLHQEPFPSRIKHDLPITIEEFDVRGSWPGLWLFKMSRLVEECKSDIIILWDEDDMFEPDYTIKVISKLQEVITSAGTPETYSCTGRKSVTAPTAPLSEPLRAGQSLFGTLSGTLCSDTPTVSMPRGRGRLTA